MSDTAEEANQEKAAVVVVFRSRLRDDAGGEYGVWAAEIAARAKGQPGIVQFKTFTAADGERVTIAEFESAEAADLWRNEARHKEAQVLGRTQFYSEYRVQVCDVRRAYAFKGSETERNKS